MLDGSLGSPVALSPTPPSRPPRLPDPRRFMTHLAAQETDDSGSPVTWREHVTDEEYNAASAS